MSIWVTCQDCGIRPSPTKTRSTSYVRKVSAVFLVDVLRELLLLRSGGMGHPADIVQYDLHQIHLSSASQSVRIIYQDIGVMDRPMEPKMVQPHDTSIEKSDASGFSSRTSFSGIASSGVFCSAL